MGLGLQAGPSAASYYGSSSYVHVEPLLRKSGRLLIVSPYIDDYYAYRLARSHSKEVYVISSSIHADTAKKLMGSRLGDAAFAVFVLAAINTLMLQLSMFSVPVFAVSVLFSAYVVRHALRHRNGVRLKVPKQFVHAKMYIGDGIAVEGSANLTYAGMHRNIERIRVVTEVGEIEAMRKSFWRLWGSVG